MSIKPTQKKSHNLPLKSIAKISAVALIGLFMPRSLHRSHQYRYQSGHQVVPVKAHNPEQQLD